MGHLLCQALSLLGVGNVLSIIALIILSIQDIKKGEIHYRYLVLMVDFYDLKGYLCLILTIVFYDLIKDYIGGADLLIFSLLMTRYGSYYVFLIFFYGALLGLIYCLILKKQQLRFIPFIFLGFLIVLKGGL